MHANHNIVSNFHWFFFFLHRNNEQNIQSKQICIISCELLANCEQKIECVRDRNGKSAWKIASGWVMPCVLAMCFYIHNIPNAWTVGYRIQRAKRVSVFSSISRPNLLYFHQISIYSVDSLSSLLLTI